MGETPTVLAQVEQAVSAKFTSVVSVWAGMAGGSITALLARLGDQDIVAGVGVVVAVLGLALKAWHNRALRRQSERIEYAKMTPEQRRVYDDI